VDKEKKSKPGLPADSVNSSELDEMYRRLHPEMRRPRPSAEAIAAAVEAAQRLAAEADAEDASDTMGQEFVEGAQVCSVCGHRNRNGTKFCGMCGVAIGGAEGNVSTAAGQAMVASPNPLPAAQMRAGNPSGLETHHYHHHYHHHYFPGAPEGTIARPGTDSPRELARELAREEKLRPMTAALRGEMSRAEAAVRRVTQEWVLASNTKHLDDLLELYTADAMVLRSNYPPVRGAAAVREFFFGALDAGLGEVEIDPLRLEVVGELAYEAGRYKALIPGATGKRREERGKYLWVCARQSNGEWKLAADCWSSDLTLTTLESDIPQGAVKTSYPRK
jgi:uncharacterized protein (TIGR02246 family)